MGSFATNLAKFGLVIMCFNSYSLHFASRHGRCCARAPVDNGPLDRSSRHPCVPYNEALTDSAFPSRCVLDL